MTQPLMFDLFCGLGGATEGFLPLGWRCIGIDIEEHVYGEERYPAELWLRDILDLHGSELCDAHFIWASPPCQEYSYMAMPWSKAKAKAKAKAIRDDESGAELERLNRLFNACFRIQKEASIAAGRHIPMVVENVRGAIPWVGRSRWNFGSFHLWGDVPALMPATMKAQKFNPDGTNHGTGSWFAIADSKNRGTRGQKNNGGSWFNIGAPGQKVVGQNPDGRLIHRRDGAPHSKHLTNPGEHEVAADFDARIGGDWFSDPNSTCRKHGSKSKGRKAASAMIAKIPEPLSRHIAKIYWPEDAPKLAE